MKKLHGLILVATVILAVGFHTGCTTTHTVTNPDGSTTTTEVFDPVKTQQVKEAVASPIKTVLHVALKKNKTHAAEIAQYIASGRDIFCKMAATKEFSHSFLEAEAEQLGTPVLVEKLQATGDDDLAILVMAGKDSILSLYKIFLADKGTVQLSDEAWGFHTATTFCDALTTALKDEGY